MLKLIYSDTGLSIEHLHSGVEEWILTCLALTHMTGQVTTFYTARTTASLLVPLTEDAPNLGDWLAPEDCCRAAAGELEVRLYGVWWAATATAETGVFVTEAPAAMEAWIWQSWQLTQPSVLISQR